MSRATESREVLYEIRGDAAWITLNRPDRRNAISPGLVAELSEALDRAAADESARAIVLTGAGRAFCAGADLSSGNPLIEDADAGPNPFAQLLQRIDCSDKPVVAAINGTAFGGGLGLIAVADIAVAVSDAVFSFSEVRLGLIPAMISIWVVPKLGAHHARRLFATGRRFSADEALAYGLIHRVTPAEGLRAAVDEEVADIAMGGPEAIAASKRWIRDLRGLSTDEAAAEATRRLGQRARSSEGREGIAAFTEKRLPGWRS